MSSQRVDVNGLFRQLQQQLTQGLKGIRKNIKHPGAKGTVAEEEWRQLLRTFLPG